MKTSYIVIGIVIAVVAIGGIAILQSNNKVQAPALGEEGMVAYSDEGYSPKELKVKKGDIVTFKNESSQSMWTASAMHPTHTVYPGTDIKNCGNPSMMDMMFDSCSAVSLGESWKFQFNETGTWGYHNHMQATHFGKIIVE